MAEDWNIPEAADGALRNPVPTVQTYALQAITDGETCYGGFMPARVPDEKNRPIDPRVEVRVRMGTSLEDTVRCLERIASTFATHWEAITESGSPKFYTDSPGVILINVNGGTVRLEKGGET